MGYRAETLIVLQEGREFSMFSVARAKKQLNADKGTRLQLFMFGKPIKFPENFKGDDTRVTIFAHGEPSSKFIGAFINPKKLAEDLRSWVGTGTFGRVALHSCYAGGNIVGTDFRVSPKISFGYELARRCGFVKSITAKTSRNIEEYVTDEDKEPTGQVHSFVLEENGGSNQNRREMKLGDKVIFFPDRTATPTHLVDPRMEFPKFAAS